MILSYNEGLISVYTLIYNTNVRYMEVQRVRDHDSGYNLAVF